MIYRKLKNYYLSIYIYIYIWTYIYDYIFKGSIDASTTGCSSNHEGADSRLHDVTDEGPNNRKISIILKVSNPSKAI